MPHELQLIVYHEISRAPAHWTMFIPDSAEAVDGKIIHIMGKQDAGYRLEIKQYDISRTRKRYTRRLIASIHDDWLPHLDSKARGVTVPARDRRSSDPFAGENCQTWLKDYVDVLVNDGVINSSARDVLRDAPTV